MSHVLQLMCFSIGTSLQAIRAELRCQTCVTRRQGETCRKKYLVLYYGGSGII